VLTTRRNEDRQMQRNRAGFRAAMKRRPRGWLFRLGLVSLAFFAFGCAHQFAITPAPDVFNAGGIGRIDKNVGYYITPENLAKEVVTPGGGGDKVKYSPYKESEPTLNQVLSNIFRDVYRVSSPNDVEFIRSKNISYIFVPTITKDSSSRSSWIWPPSDFTVSLDCEATDGSGSVVWETSIKAEAHMRLPDVYRDHALAGKEAIRKVFLDL
jgi:hypothetical protein